MCVISAPVVQYPPPTTQLGHAAHCLCVVNGKQLLSPPQGFTLTPLLSRDALGGLDGDLSGAGVCLCRRWNESRRLIKHYS